MTPSWTQALARRLALWNRRRLHRRHQRTQLPYADWCARHDTLDVASTAALQARIDALPETAAVALLLVPDEATAAATDSAPLWASLRAQLHPRWQLHVLGSAADGAAWRLRAAADARVRLHPTCHDARDLLARLDEPWCAWPTAADTWRPHALGLLLEAAWHRADTRLVYADEDRLDAHGRRTQPWFKGDFDADALLACDSIGRPALWHREHLLLMLARALAADPPTAVRRGHALALAGAAALAAVQVQHVPHVLCHAAAALPCPDGADAAAVQRHLDRDEPGGSAHQQPTTGLVRVRFALPQPAPSVTVVIPTRNGLQLLRRCVTSLLVLSSYSHFRILIVDNGSDDPACLRWLGEIAGDPRVQVRRDDRPFNFAALNNDAIATLDTDLIALVNNDIELISPGWLEEMVSLAARPGVGAVGARLWYEDGVLQHAGVVMGVHGSAGHVPKHLRRDEAGPGARAWRLQQAAAVTAACLVLRRDLYQAVGGMDEAAFAVAYNDVDLCLKLNARGHRTLWTPHAELFHHESVSRGKDRIAAQAARLAAEQQALQQRWPGWIARDPFYNPNLSLTRDDMALAEPPRVNLRRRWFDAD